MAGASVFDGLWRSLAKPLNHAGRGSHFAEVAVRARFVSEFGQDEASFLVAGQVGRDLEDVVEAGPDAIGFAAHGVGEDFDEEEEGGVPLLHGAEVPGPGLQWWGCGDFDRVFELLCT